MSNKEKDIYQKIEKIEDVGRKMDRISIDLLFVLLTGAVFGYLLKLIEYNYLKLAIYLSVFSFLFWLIFSVILIIIKKTICKRL